jgi:histidinol dehydrogenase
MIQRRNLSTGDEVDFGRRHPVGEADPETHKRVREILKDVRRNGWEAVGSYSREFDDVRPNRAPVSASEIESSWKSLDESARDALRLARDRIRRYQESIQPRSTLISDADGALGEIVRPYQRVGCYIPGGRFPLPSTVLMTAYVAEVAGVEEIVIASPPVEDRTPHPVVQAACHLLDDVELYGVGGVQAIGAMTYGAGEIAPVDLVVGPGNLYVTLAKKQVYGTVEIDMLAGPSEIAVVAEPSASDPEYVAADLLSQAEHDPMSRSYLLTPHAGFADDVESEISTQLRSMRDTEVIESALESSALIVTESLEDAVERVDDLAPEHLELHLEMPGRWAREIRNAGAVFLGRRTPEPFGDYTAGPSHTLPTGGGARYFSPLSVRTFRKSQSLIKAGERVNRQTGEPTVTLAELEGLPAHAESMATRVRDTEEGAD